MVGGNEGKLGKRGGGGRGGAECTKKGVGVEAAEEGAVML
jgi:hypothetical protein